MTERSYRSSFLGLGVMMFVGENLTLQSAIQRQLDLDFGLYDRRGGGTTIAHLRWRPDGSAEMEGIAGPIETHARMAFASREAHETHVAERWVAFTANQEGRHRLEQEYKINFPEPMLLGPKGTKVPGDWAGEVIHLTKAEHIYGWIGDENVKLTYGTINREMPEIATATRLGDGSFVFVSKYGSKLTVEAGLDKMAAAERWIAFTNKAGQDADFDRTRAREAWREGSVYAGL